MSTTTLDHTDTAGVLASIRRIVGEGGDTPSIAADGERLTVPMLALDSTQRAIADAAELERVRTDAMDRLEGMQDAALGMRSERFRTTHRDQGHTGQIAPIPVSANPALNAMRLANVASYGRSETEAAQETAIAAQRMKEATAEHDAALEARSARFRASNRNLAR